MLKKDKLNCFQDLQRAATFYYLNPKGNTHNIFLSHALAILKGIKDKKAQECKVKLEFLQKKLREARDEDKKKLADEILTTGLLLKS